MNSGKGLEEAWANGSPQAIYGLLSLFFIGPIKLKKLSEQ